jgi:hypothetical protein
MAKKRRSVVVRRSGGGGRSAAPVIVVPSAAPARRASTKRRGGGVRRGRRKGGFNTGALAKSVWEEKYALASIGGAGLVGYLEARGSLTFVPDFGGIGRVPTLAIAAYVGGRVLKQPRLRQAGIGLAAAAAFAFGVEQGSKK